MFFAITFVYLPIAGALLTRVSLALPAIATGQKGIGIVTAWKNGRNLTGILFGHMLFLILMMFVCKIFMQFLHIKLLFVYFHGVSLSNLAMDVVPPIFIFMFIWYWLTLSSKTYVQAEITKTP